MEYKVFDREGIALGNLRKAKERLKEALYLMDDPLVYLQIKGGIVGLQTRNSIEMVLRHAERMESRIKETSPDTSSRDKARTRDLALDTIERSEMEIGQIGDLLFRLLPCKSATEDIELLNKAEDLRDTLVRTEGELQTFITELRKNSEKLKHDTL